MFRAFRAGRCRGCPQRSRGVSGHCTHDTGFARSIRAALEKTRLARALMLLAVLLISAPPALADSCGSSDEGEFVGAAPHGFEIQVRETLERSFSAEMREEEKFPELPVREIPASPCADGTDERVDRKLKKSPDNTDMLLQKAICRMNEKGTADGLPYWERANDQDSMYSLQVGALRKGISSLR